MNITEFNRRIWDVMRSLSHGIDKTLRIIVEGSGITLVQMRVLVELNHSKESTIGELGTAIGSAPGNASALCKTLEKKGLVSRTRNPDDERIVLVSLTEQGKRLLQEIEAEQSAKFDQLLEKYSEEDFQLILAGMSKLKDVVTNLHQEFDATQNQRR